MGVAEDVVVFSIHFLFKDTLIFHNSTTTRLVYLSALPPQPKAGFIPVNLSTSNFICRNL